MERFARTSRRFAWAISALVVGFGFGALLSFGHAQDRVSAPPGAPWGSRSAGSDPGPRSPSKSFLRTPAAPSPGRPSATQRAALRTLSGGPGLPPPGLAFLHEGPAARAAKHRSRADALDALAVRCARRMKELAPRGSDRHVCLAANAARRAMELALTAGVQRADTAATLEAEAAAFAPPTAVASDRTAGPDTSARLRELRRQARQALIPELEDQDCHPVTSTVLAGGVEPRVHLSLIARRPVGGRVVFFVKVPPETPVIWVDDRPEGLAEYDGWGVVTAHPRSVALCASTPEADRCDPSHRVVPTMGDAYDLEWALELRDAAALQSPLQALPTR